MIQSFLILAIENYFLTFFVLGLITAGIATLLHRDRRDARSVAATFLTHYLFFAVGLMFVFNFVMHVFFAEMCAGFIGWANSPFQYEVGYASLGFGVVALLACWKGFEMKLAAVLGPAFFLWGAAGGHAYQMITAHNFAPGNAGVVFWTDIFIPIVGLVLLCLARPGKTA